MTRNKVLLSLIISGIIAVIIYASYRMLNVSSEKEYSTVSVILDNSSSDRWTAFREGLEQGALEERVYISVVSTDTFRSVGEEASAIRKELENGTDGLIVEPCRGDANNQLADTLPQTACVLAGFGLSAEKELDVVKPDWYEMGAAVAGKAAEYIAGESAGARIGILCGNLRLEDMVSCLHGATDTLSDILAETDAAIIWEKSAEEVKSAEDLAEKISQGPVDVILALEDGMTELAVNSISAQENSGRKDSRQDIQVFGIGRSEKNIASLDEGLIQTLVVPDEYFMGYHCIKILAQKLGYHLSRTETARVPFVTVTKENIYEEDVETVLFPVVR